MEPMKLELTLDLDSYLMGQTAGHDEDGIPQPGPTTLEQVVLEMAANVIVNRIAGETSWHGDDETKTQWKAIRDEILTIAGTLATEAVDSMVEEEMTALTYEPSEDGRSVLSKTIAERVQERTREAVKLRPEGKRGSFRAEKSTLEAIIDDQVNRTIERETKKAVEEARNAVIAEVRNRAAQAFAKAMGDEAESTHAFVGETRSRD